MWLAFRILLLDEKLIGLTRMAVPERNNTRYVEMVFVGRVTASASRRAGTPLLLQRSYRTGATPRGIERPCAVRPDGFIDEAFCTVRAALQSPSRRLVGVAGRGHAIRSSRLRAISPP